MGNIAEKLEDLDLKDDSKFMKWIKRIAYVVTIVTTLSGGVLGVIAFFRDAKDPRAQFGYTEHSSVLEELGKNVKENRDEILDIYKTLANKKMISKNRNRKINGVVVRKPKKWDKLKK